MQNNTNLGMSLGKMLAGAFDGSAKQKGMEEGYRINSYKASADKSMAEAEQTRQETEARSDGGLAKSLVAGMQNGINGDNVSNDFNAYLKGEYKPREQQGPAMAPGSYMPAPEYVSQFPELQRKHSKFKQMIALGDKDFTHLSKSAGQDYENDFVSGRSPQSIEDYASRQAAIKGNVLDISQNNRINSLANAGLTPEAKKQLTESIILGNKDKLYDFSANGVGDNATGEYTTSQQGDSVIRANDALAGQRNSAIDLNRSNTKLIGAKTVNEQNKANGTDATLDPNGRAYSTKPLPTPALKMQQEELETIGTVSGTNADLAAIQSQIKTGALELGTFKNYLAGAKNYMGMSDESSQNFATLQATLEKARNSSLLLNKGVQTDGDAQRAWNELLSNINDPKVVEKRLGEIQSINERAVKIRKAKLGNLRKNYNAPPLDYSEFDSPNTSVQNGSKNNSSARSIVRTGIYQGRKVVQYNDGSTEFAE